MEIGDFAHCGKNATTVNNGFCKSIWGVELEVEMSFSERVIQMEHSVSSM